jgi:hypothetical protein
LFALIIISANNGQRYRRLVRPEFAHFLPTLERDRPPFDVITSGQLRCSSSDGTA